MVVPIPPSATSLKTHQKTIKVNCKQNQTQNSTSMDPISNLEMSDDLPIQQTHRSSCCDLYQHYSRRRKTKPPKTAKDGKGILFHKLSTFRRKTKPPKTAKDGKGILFHKLSTFTFSRVFLTAKKVGLKI